jgi:sialate O-acetylesterase
MKAGKEPMVLTVKGRNTLAVKNVLIGDVWFCSGQSNMGFPLEKDNLAATEIPASANPMIRLLQVDWQSSDTPLDSVRYSDKRKGDIWLEAAPDTVGASSAVAYWFGKDLQKSTGVPIGLIRSAKGGSPIEAWMPKEVLLASDGGREVLDKYLEALKVFPEKNAVYQTELKEWQEKTKSATPEEKKASKRPTPPYGPTDPNHPCGLFYGSVSPYAPLAIKGVIWYQGESNACSPMDKAVNYHSLFTGLIKSWRKEWGQENLPFLFVELAPFRLMSPTPEDSVWSRVRDAQFKALSLPNTGMAVILDAGNESDIHPKDKKPVGERLAQWAKAKVYGMDVVPSGPLYEKMEVKGNKIVITFNNAGKGLEARDLTLIGNHQLSKDKLQGFAICGDDKKFVWAEAAITAPNQVTLSSSEVKAPVAARYAWSSFPLCNLFNKDGFPAAAFRTDNFAPDMKAPPKSAAPANMNSY